jgi:hypothetical protein
MIWRLVAKLAQKAAEKTSQLRADDIMTQQTTDDVIHLLKELIL